MDDSPAGHTVNTTSSSPWSGQQPYLTTGFERAEELLDTPKSYYPNDTVVPFSQQTEAGLQAQEARALQGSELTGAAQGLLSDTLAGDYLDAGNPAFAAMADRVQNTIRPRIDSQFASAGRYGGQGHQEQMERTYGDIMAPLAFQNYQSERGAMQDAMRFAPELANQDYTDIAMLRDTGTAREGLARDQIASDIDRFNFEQQEPIDRLARYMSLVAGGRYGGDTQTSQPYYTNTAGNILGGAQSAVGILGGIKDLGFF